MKHNFDLTADIWKDRPKLGQNKYFHGDDVIRDITERPHSSPYIFLYKWNQIFFRDN